MSLLSKVVSGYAWVFLGFVAKALAQFAALVVLSRMLGKEEYGEVSLVIALYNLLWTSFEVAIGYTVLRLPTRRQSYLHGLFTVSMISGVLVTGAMVLGGHMMTDMYHSQNLFWPSVALSAAVLMRASSVVSEYLLNKEMQFSLLARIEIASYAGFVGALAATIWAGFAYWALPIAQIAYMVVKSGLCLYGRPHSMALVINRRIFRQIGHFIAGYTGTSFLSTAAGEGDKLVVGKMLGLGALGVYGRALQLFMLPASVIGQALDNVLTSALSANRRDYGRCARAVYSSTAMIALAMIPGSVFFYMLVPEIVDIVLGENWQDVVMPLQILCFGMYFRVAMKTAEAVLRAQGMVYQRMVAYIVFDASLVLGLFFGAYYGGMFGASVAVSASNLFFYFILMVPVVRFLKLSVSKLLVLHVRGAVLAAILWILSTNVLVYIRALTQVHILVVLAYTAVVGVAFVALCAGFGLQRVLGPDGVAVYEQALGWVRRKTGRVKAVS